MSRTYRSDETGRKLRRYSSVRFPGGTPRWWRHIHMTIPLRRENKRLCHQVLRGQNPDAIPWPLGCRKPHVYYW